MYLWWSKCFHVVSKALRWTQMSCSINTHQCVKQSLCLTHLHLSWHLKFDNESNSKQIYFPCNKSFRWQRRKVEQTTMQDLQTEITLFVHNVMYRHLLNIRSDTRVSTVFLGMRMAGVRCIYRPTQDGKPSPSEDQETADPHGHGWQHRRGLEHQPRGKPTSSINISTHTHTRDPETSGITVMQYSIPVETMPLKYTA